jgi:hypothetical protein
MTEDAPRDDDQADDGQADGRTGWALGEDERALLDRLIAELRGLLPLAKSNAGLIALGEVLEAVETARDGGRIEDSVALLVGVHDGDDEYNEGWYVRMRVFADGIVLDRLSTTCSVEIGPDQYTTDYAELKPGGGFDATSVDAWLAELADMRRWEAAEVKGAA